MHRENDGQYKKTASNQKLIDLYGEYKFTSLSEGISKSVLMVSTKL